MPRALISVFYKDGVVELARGLLGLGWELVSSGGTANKLKEAGLPVIDVADITGFPPMLGHRVVTLHPKVHGAILADHENPEHVADLGKYDIGLFDLVVVNVYPFAEKLAEGASFDDCIENIDIGGPAMIRAAAKNHKYVGVVMDIDDYAPVLTELMADGRLSDETRKRLAAKAFARTAAYDLAVATWLGEGQYAGIVGDKVFDCDYGENRWQKGALYREIGDTDPLGLHNIQVVAGRTPSFINVTDQDRLMQTATHLVAEHELNFGQRPCVAIAVKHGNACGVGVGLSPEEVIKLMVTGDTRAVHGAVVMVNFLITGELASLLTRHASDVRRLLDGICAPGFDDEATGSLGRRDGKFFLGVLPGLAELSLDSLDTRPLVRPVRGGFLLEDNYTKVIDLSGSEVRGELGERNRKDMATAIAVCATSNSNTITLVKNGQLIGNGVGQQDRVGAAELATGKARASAHDLADAVAVSDSFFPFDDGPRTLIDAGVSTIYSTTGSKNDGDTQQLCEERGVTLVQDPDADARMFYRH